MWAEVQQAGGAARPMQAPGKMPGFLHHEITASPNQLLAGSAFTSQLPLPTNVHRTGQLHVG